jgi:hypothetical protein
MHGFPSRWLVAGHDQRPGFGPDARRASFPVNGDGESALRPSPGGPSTSGGAGRSMQSVVVRFMSRPALGPTDVFQATRLPFDPGSTVAGCAFSGDGRPTWRSFGARPCSHVRYLRKLTPTVIRRSLFASKCVKPFSLKRGLNSTLDFLKLGITFFLCSRSIPKRRRATLLGRPRFKQLCG